MASVPELGSNAAAPRDAGAFNPVGPVAHAGDRGARVSAIAFEGKKRAMHAVAVTSNAFKEKPYQSTAVVFSAISVAFLIIACLAPWSIFSGDSAGVHVSAAVTLFEYRNCADNSEANPDPYTPVKGCLVVQLVNGPRVLQYMHRAGAATFAFTFMAILPGLLAFYLTYIRRIGRLDDGLPNAFAGMKNVLVTPILHGVTALFALIAFSIWAGQLNSERGEATWLAFGILGNRSHTFSGGFGVTVTAFILCVACAALTHFFSNEILHVATRGAVGYGGGGDVEAVADSRVDTSGLPPGTVPAATFIGGSYGGDEPQHAMGSVAYDSKSMKEVSM